MPFPTAIPLMAKKELQNKPMAKIMSIMTLTQPVQPIVKELHTVCIFSC